LAQTASLVLASKVPKLATEDREHTCFGVEAMLIGGRCACHCMVTRGLLHHRQETVTALSPVQAICLIPMNFKIRRLLVENDGSSFRI